MRERIVRGNDGLSELGYTKNPYDTMALLSSEEGSQLFRLFVKIVVDNFYLLHTDVNFQRKNLYKSIVCARLSTVDIENWLYFM